MERPGDPTRLQQLGAGTSGGVAQPRGEQVSVDEDAAAGAGLLGASAPEQKRLRHVAEGGLLEKAGEPEAGQNRGRRGRELLGHTASPRGRPVEQDDAVAELHEAKGAGAAGRAAAQDADIDPPGCRVRHPRQAGRSRRRSGIMPASRT